ncbi:hypothetical protein DMA12_35495 [Amycolatopsis balhimycina DSM 5908]|uniref:Uncharacterized protein n=2 Tax=Amycolatopsis balhimycina TaxID=208443 RepID=A0A428W3Y1_AMYBA|nr:hypothetical protein DMA12_35495 [Amycolatopsis balhimycina DSM 5908]
MVLSGALFAFGVLLASAGQRGSVLPYVYFVAFGGSLAMWTYVLSLYRRVQRLFGEPYHRLDVAPDGMLVKGSRVSVRLPDGRWLRTGRIPDGPRAQLAGERRLWVLGGGRRVFVRLPGAMWLRAGRIEDAPLPGATSAELVSRHPTPPRHDPVLAANRAFRIRRTVLSGVVFLVLGGAGLAFVANTRVDPYAVVDPAAVGGVAGGSGVLVLLGLLMLVGVLRLRPITEDVWVELRVALDTQFVPRTRGVARLTGWALHPDGRQTRFRLVADVSLAANVAATGQLWLQGYPRPGKPAKAGLPGYPYGGSFR